MNYEKITDNKDILLHHVNMEALFNKDTVDRRKING